MLGLCRFSIRVCRLWCLVVGFLVFVGWGLGWACFWGLVGVVILGCLVVLC